MNYRKHALVISGGGAKGAWAVGALRHLFKDKNQRFDLVVGTSTGALIAPLAALGEIDDLVRIYTTVKDTDVISFRFPGKNVVMNALASLLRGKDSIYGTGPLRKTIDQHLSQGRWNRLVAGPVPAWVSTVSLQTGEIRYIGSHQPGVSRERFAAAMLASGSIPVYMQRIRIPGEDGQWFVDGGVKDVIPLGHAIREGARDITAILLGIEPPPAKDEFKRIHKMLLRTISLQMEETAANDLGYGDLITRELLWRSRLRNILARGTSDRVVDAAFEEASTQDEPLSAKGRRFAAVRLRLLRPKEEIGDTLDFRPERLKAYEQAGYDFAVDDSNWSCIPAHPLYDEPLRIQT
jgi:NTE family protein